MGAAFKISNPVATASCGCGTSFFDLTWSLLPSGEKVRVERGRPSCARSSHPPHPGLKRRPLPEGESFTKRPPCHVSPSAAPYSATLRSSRSRCRAQPCAKPWRNFPRSRSCAVLRARRSAAFAKTHVGVRRRRGDQGPQDASRRRFADSHIYVVQALVGRVSSRMLNHRSPPAWLSRSSRQPAKGCSHSLAMARPDALEIESTDFLADNVSLVLQDKRSGKLYAALDHGHFGVKMHVADGPGAEWTETARARLSAKARRFARQGHVGQSAALEHGARVGTGNRRPEGSGVIWCGTIPGGLFRSEDQAPAGR